ncbi:hypothetical protein BGZ63DRAFT_409780 [Mariannaea sp. PMI_226]|nr:hypothetical protein BGZ63DRAFT_409780 [Mariannaea sp. PMI_226]
MTRVNNEKTVNSLKSSIKQTDQLYRVADTETDAYRNACNTGTRPTTLPLIVTIASCFIPGGAIIPIVGAYSTAKCHHRSYKNWREMKNSSQGTFQDQATIEL